MVFVCFRVNTKTTGFFNSKSWHWRNVVDFTEQKTPGEIRGRF
jgi:hypothetical protein